MDDERAVPEDEAGASEPADDEGTAESGEDGSDAAEEPADSPPPTDEPSGWQSLADTAPDPPRDPADTQSATSSTDVADTTEHTGAAADVEYSYEPTEYEPPDPLDDFGPADDKEMPLADHIEEMLKRLAVVVAVAGLVSLITFPFAERIINFLWNSLLPAGELTRPRLYGILELKLTELKVASLAGVIIALPVIVYETYQFMRPGLYPHERRYYLAAIPTSLVLAFVGVSFAYFIVLPAIFLYFTAYTQGVAGIGFALGRTFDLILLLMGYMALVFQIPLFVLLAMMMNLVTRQWLADRRLLFWGAFLGVSFIFSPDPTGMAPIIVALTMIVLFEGTLLLTKWTARGRAIGGG